VSLTTALMLALNWVFARSAGMGSGECADRVVRREDGRIEEHAG
jgi:hypothetical protein